MIDLFLAVTKKRATIDIGVIEKENLMTWIKTDIKKLNSESQDLRIEKLGESEVVDLFKNTDVLGGASTRRTL